MLSEPENGSIHVTCFRYPLIKKKDVLIDTQCLYVNPDHCDYYKVDRIE